MRMGCAEPLHCEVNTDKHIITHNSLTQCFIFTYYCLLSFFLHTQLFIVSLPIVKQVVPDLFLLIICILIKNVENLYPQEYNTILIFINILNKGIVFCMCLTILSYCVFYISSIRLTLGCRQKCFQTQTNFQNLAMQIVWYCFCIISVYMVLYLLLFLKVCKSLRFVCKLCCQSSVVLISMPIQIVHLLLFGVFQFWNILLYILLLNIKLEKLTKVLNTMRVCYTVLSHCGMHKDELKETILITLVFLNSTHFTQCIMLVYCCVLLNLLLFQLLSILKYYFLIIINQVMLDLIYNVILYSHNYNKLVINYRRVWYTLLLYLGMDKHKQMKTMLIALVFVNSTGLTWCIMLAHCCALFNLLHIRLFFVLKYYFLIIAKPVVLDLMYGVFWYLHNYNKLATILDKVLVFCLRPTITLLYCSVRLINYNIKLNILGLWQKLLVTCSLYLAKQVVWDMILALFLLLEVYRTFKFVRKLCLQFVLFIFICYEITSVNMLYNPYHIKFTMYVVLYYSMKKNISPPHQVNCTKDNPFILIPTNAIYSIHIIKYTHLLLAELYVFNNNISRLFSKTKNTQYKITCVNLDAIMSQYFNMSICYHQTSPLTLKQIKINFLGTIFFMS